MVRKLGFVRFGLILLKNSNIWILNISTKSTPLLNFSEDCRERFQGAATELEAHFNRTPRQNPSIALCGDIFSDFGENRSFSTE